MGGVSPSSVNAWEHEERRPSAEVWTRLAAFFRERGLEVPPMPDDLPHGRRTFQRARMGTDPGKLRGNRVLQSRDEFYEAFDIQDGDGMWLPAENRVTIW